MRQNDPIKHVMSTDVVTIPPIEKFSAAKKLMETNRCGPWKAEG